MKRFFLDLISRVMPFTIRVHFRTPDDIVSSVHCIDSNKVLFFSLAEPCLAKDCKPNGRLGEYKIKYNAARVALYFYTPESVGKFIKMLETVKLNIELREAAKILNAGGTMTWEKKIDNPLPEGVIVETFQVTFKMPPNEQESQVSDTTKNNQGGDAGNIKI